MSATRHHFARKARKLFSDPELFFHDMFSKRIARRGLGFPGRAVAAGGEKQQPNLLQMDFRPRAHLSRFTREVIEAQKFVRGPANPDDALHFSLVLGYQREMGPPGDLLEIGTYFGRSAMVMAWFVGPGERLVLCDAFEHETRDKYAATPTSTDVVSAIRRSTPRLDPEMLVIHKGLSSSLVLEPASRFRFVHIDGGHSTEEARGDLELVKPHIPVGGVIAVDDYDHPRWPGVHVAADAFLADHPEFTPFADVNRWVALGRKLYLVRTR